MDPTSRVRPARLGAAPPSLVPNAKQVAQPRAHRAALADVSNRDPNQQVRMASPSHTVPSPASEGQGVQT